MLLFGCVAESDLRLRLLMLNFSLIIEMAIRGFPFRVTRRLLELVAFAMILVIQVTWVDVVLVTFCGLT